MNPATNEHRFDLRNRENGMDWPEAAHSMIGAKRLRSLARQTVDVIENQVPGDFIETGVWRGGACILMTGIARAMQAEDRITYVADSFEGLPKPDAASYPADRGDLHHTVDQLAISLEEVRANFAAYGLLDDRVRFVKGWFKDTLHRVDCDQFSIVRLDGDMYESTIQAFEALYPKLSVGGYLVVDDFHAVPGCRKAAEDFRKAHGIQEDMVEIDWTGVFWQRRS